MKSKITLPRLAGVVALAFVAVLAFASPSYAQLLNLSQTFPRIQFDSGGETTYASGLLRIEASTLGLQFGPPPMPPCFITLSPDTFTINVMVDGSGVVSGVPGHDLVVEGVPQFPPFCPPISGAILTGEVLELGYSDSPDRLEFRFSVTGGALATFFGGINDIAVLVRLDDPISGTSTFNGTFAGDFAGGAAGDAGATVKDDTGGGQLPHRATLLLIDEDSLGNGKPPNFFLPEDVNDHLATLALRSELPFFDAHPGETITLHTGEVGDEGWFALTTVPAEWAAAGPTPDGARNYVGNPSQPYPHNVGPGLGAGPDPEKLLDKIPGVTPLRAAGLKQLEGQRICAVVYDSDISMNYGPLNGSLKGANLGTVAFEVVTVMELTGYSSMSLPAVEVTILDADEVCEEQLRLLEDVPQPTSSSEPADTRP